MRSNALNLDLFYLRYSEFYDYNDSEAKLI